MRNRNDWKTTPWWMRNAARAYVATALLGICITLAGCTKNGGRASNFELEILVARGAKDDASGAAMLDSLVRTIGAGGGDSGGWVASKVGISGAAFPNDRVELDAKGMILPILGSSVDALHFTRKWDETRKSDSDKPRLDAIAGPGSNTDERTQSETAFLKQVGDGVVLIFDGSLSPTANLATIAGREMLAFSDLAALRQEILQRLKQKNSSSPSPKIAVIVRGGGDRVTGDVSLEILTPQIGETGTKPPPEVIAALQKIAAAGAGVPGLDIGLRRDDALDERISVGTKGIWESDHVRGLLGRADRPRADHDGGVETMMGTLGESALVIGYTLPPISVNQTEQVAERVPRLFGAHSVDFYREVAVVSDEVAKALSAKRKVAVVVRYPPSRALERVIVRAPVTFRESPQVEAAAVRDGSGREVAAKWFEVLFIWERKDGVDRNGQPIKFLYVSDQERPANGGEAGGRRKGWIPETSAAPWKTQLVMRFTHPGGRKPCVFFGDAAKLRSIVEAPDDARKQQAGDIFQAIEAKRGQYPEGVNGVEPEFGVDWREGLYLLPILSFEKQQQANGNGIHPTIFHTVCLTRGGADATRNRRLTGNGAKRDSVDLDLVFVMDLTMSMEAFVKPTRDALARLTSGLLAKAGAESRRLRFGIWGYRDGFWDTRDQNGQPLREGRAREIPGIGFVTNNFTPALQDGTAFLSTLSGVHETKVDSIDYMEDTLAGLADAIQKTQWRKDAARIIVLVGDAPGRENGQVDTPFLDSHPRYRGKEGTELPLGTRSGMDVSTLRQLATEKSVFIGSIYLRDPRFPQYHKLGEEQFRAFGSNPGGATIFSSVDARVLSGYFNVVDGLSEVMGEQLFRLPRTSGGGTPSAGGESNSDSFSAGADMARGLFEAVVRDSQRAGCNLTVDGWAWDRDLVDPTQRPVEPCILVSRLELNSLYETLNGHVFHLKSGKVGPNDFLQGLKLVSAWLLTKFQGTISESDFGRAQADLAYLRSLLPYESLALQVSAGEWAAYSASERNKFVAGLEARLKLYEKIQEDTIYWKALREGDDPQDYVAQLPLEKLP